MFFFFFCFRFLNRFLNGFGTGDEKDKTMGDKKIGSSNVLFVFISFHTHR